MSVGTGLTLHPDVSVVIKKNDNLTLHASASAKDNSSTIQNKVEQQAANQFFDNAHMNAGLYLQIPFMVHFNIPVVEFLYLGAGVAANIPVWGPDSLVGDNIAKYFKDGIAGNTFLSVPIDVGFDFCKRGRGSGARLLFRIQPEFFQGGFMSCPISLTWQIWNWRVHSKHSRHTSKSSWW
jgi:hypothetical protein